MDSSLYVVMWFGSTMADCIDFQREIGYVELSGSHNGYLSGAALKNNRTWYTTCAASGVGTVPLSLCSIL